MSFQVQKVLLSLVGSHEDWMEQDPNTDIIITTTAIIIIVSVVTIYS